ncbi:type II toxin-antitoxin system RelE/ParE family toxin [Asticcacaulis sp. EMRT-3]|uniref:type II toxin-antitoxin system RelE/ParE family toxin n=1 Tax=Asticcacaulis sp. EMRT-3 TaxID=3040349 RepID=UPI0024AFCF82|nr:type II toxin-antitoxin system RelE/ParE family toxin [Asticcacaulis sp. EMRT-3]MDI7774681.1 type II toxin-antitoxin system RelE/ParE family toxin [Asticcacaulis sp. EMRT-3]
MTNIIWRIRFTAPAEIDFRRIIGYTEEQFGVRQAAGYRKLIRDALVALQHGPNIPGSAMRDEIHTGLRTYHIARRGKRARHFILYRASDDHIIEVIRILHDAMDLARHLPRDVD